MNFIQTTTFITLQRITLSIAANIPARVEQILVTSRKFGVLMMMVVAWLAISLKLRPLARALLPCGTSSNLDARQAESEF
jgi:hypothetical protein